MSDIPLAVAKHVDMPSIRSGTMRDTERFSQFLTALSKEFIVGEFAAEGRAHFMGQLSAAEMEQRLSGDFRLYLAEDGNELAGQAETFPRTSLGTADRHPGGIDRILGLPTMEPLARRR